MNSTSFLSSTLIVLASLLFGGCGNSDSSDNYGSADKQSGDAPATETLSGTAQDAANQLRESADGLQASIPDIEPLTKAEVANLREKVETSAAELYQVIAESNPDLVTNIQNATKAINESDFLTAIREYKPVVVEGIANGEQKPAMDLAANLSEMILGTNFISGENPESDALVVKAMDAIENRNLGSIIPNLAQVSESLKLNDEQQNLLAEVRDLFSPKTMMSEGEKKVDAFLKGLTGE